MKDQLERKSSVSYLQYCALYLFVLKKYFHRLAVATPVKSVKCRRLLWRLFVVAPTEVVSTDRIFKLASTAEKIRIPPNCTVLRKAED